MNQRKAEVDMSSRAIDSRLREVAQLRKLGLSIAKAKPIPAPSKLALSKPPIKVKQPAESKTKEPPD